MTGTTYILRTARGANAMAFDTLHRAIEARRIYEKRVGIPFRVIEVTTTEKELEL